MHLMETLDLSFNEIQSYHEENVKNMQAWRTKWIHNGTHLSPTDQRKGIQVGGWRHWWVGGGWWVEALINFEVDGYPESDTNVQYKMKKTFQ